MLPHHPSFLRPTLPGHLWSGLWPRCHGPQHGMERGCQIWDNLMWLPLRNKGRSTKFNLECIRLRSSCRLLLSDFFQVHHCQKSRVPSCALQQFILVTEDPFIFSCHPFGSDVPTVSLPWNQSGCQAIAYQAPVAGENVRHGALKRRLVGLWIPPNNCIL